ncbi:unnamed protein product, partial [Amoebophrya sp. A25]
KICKISTKGLQRFDLLQVDSTEQLSSKDSPKLLGGTNQRTGKRATVRAECLFSNVEVRKLIRKNLKALN